MFDASTGQNQMPLLSWYLAVKWQYKHSANLKLVIQHGEYLNHVKELISSRG